MAGITIELADSEIKQALRDLRRLLADPEPLMAEIGEIVLSQAQDSFREQQSPAGDAWQPSQRALEQGGQTLIDTGQLLASLNNEIEVMPDSVTVGSSKIYAAIHQFGGDAGAGHKVQIPARPYLPDEETVDMAEIRAAIDAHFEEAYR
ncbi:phage virion morphogenesis protein [Dethiosulfatarculus sandiegensis]|uniref:phage virion morphogenesis protein n=1 Tax=Dethiosulfatarculus sandiegensis TaxID=1429043 RepID=UPI0006989F6B|nr:phage virion morphogenesis protein [Dethiosulfatarculus sandiegensis]